MNGSTVQVFYEGVHIKLRKEKKNVAQTTTSRDITQNEIF